VGLRGAVPIVFATYPLLAGIEKANVIFDIVFFISVTSVLIQGTTIPLVAKWLKMDLPLELKIRNPLDEFMADKEKSFKKEIYIPESNSNIGKRIVDLELPRAALIIMIVRGNKYLTPTGSTIILANDVLLILTNSKNGIKRVEEALGLNPDRFLS
jgi:cell volume regulation protein A